MQFKYGMQGQNWSEMMSTEELGAIWREVQLEQRWRIVNSGSSWKDQMWWWFRVGAKLISYTRADAITRWWSMMMRWTWSELRRWAGAREELLSWKYLLGARGRNSEVSYDLTNWSSLKVKLGSYSLDYEKSRARASDMISCVYIHKVCKCRERKHWEQEWIHDEKAWAMCVLI